MKLSIFSGIAATLISAVAVFAAPTGESSGATPFYITAPVGAETYTKGGTATIKWSNGIKGAFKIDVLTGDDPAAMQSAGVTLTAEGSKGYYEWKVPEDLQDGTYAFVFQHSKGESYSNQFKIVSASGEKTPSKTEGPSDTKAPTGGKLPADTKDTTLTDTKDTTKAVTGNTLSTTTKETTAGGNTPAITKATTGSTMETVNKATTDRITEAGKKAITGNTLPAGARADVQTGSRSNA